MPLSKHIWLYVKYRNLGSSLRSFALLKKMSKNISSDSSHLELLDGHAFFLSLIPVPLVDLALAKGETVSHASNVFSGPVRILFELVF